VQTQSTAHPAVLTPRIPVGPYCPWPKAQDVGRLRSRVPSPAAPPQSWPSATCSLMDVAHQQLIAECGRHAELTYKRDELLRAYLDLVQSGAWVTSTPAQDRMFDLIETERALRQIEVSLIGEEGRRGY
jgi:hypothetical protein